jgi:membrane-associated HD superfamily phosphohydrolase
MANQRKLTGVTDDMSAWDIANMQKLGGRSALTKPQQSQYLNRETGNPVIFDQEHNRYVDSVSNEPVQSFVRNVAYRNAFGDQVYAGGPGQTPAMAISSQYRPIEAMSDKEIERFQPKKEQRASLEKEQNSLNKQNEIAQKQYTAISKLRQVINSKNKLTGAVIRTQMPRLSGEVGNLNESEQQVWTGSQALLDRVGQWLLRQGESELTETNRKELSDLIDTFEGSIQEATKQAKGRSQQSLAVNYAIPKPFSDRALTIPTALPHSEAQKKQLREKKSGKVVPIKADKYDAALKSGLFEEVQ